jgi:hypothetical protein
MSDTPTYCGGCGHPMHWKGCYEPGGIDGAVCSCDNSMTVEWLAPVSPGSPTMPDTPEVRLRAALDALHPSARYVRVEAIDLAAHMRHIDTLTAAVRAHVVRARETLMDPPSFDQRSLALDEIDAVLAILNGEH